MLIKNKVELARSAANSICSHNGLIGLRSIWQNQLAHHITELTIRLNQTDGIGITTQLRLKDAQLKCRSKYSLLDEKCTFSSVKVKNNLTYNIIRNAAKLGFHFQETQANTNNIEIRGTELTSLLSGKELRDFIDSKNLNIFTTDQLIEEEGNRLLSWKQVRWLRGYKGKGRKPNWFKTIEGEMLANHNSREVLDKFKILDTNREALKASRQKISKDKRKKEWVIFKERNIFVFGKITKKTNGRFTLTHWKSENPRNISRASFTKCKGCGMGRKNNFECLINKPISKWH